MKHALWRFHITLLLGFLHSVSNRAKCQAQWNPSVSLCYQIGDMNIKFFTYYLCEGSEQHCQCNVYLSYISIINTMLCSHWREKERVKIKKRKKERNTESSSELSCIKRLSEFTSIFSTLMHWLCLYQLTVEFCIQLIDLTHVPGRTCHSSHPSYITGLVESIYQTSYWTQ